MWKLPDDSSPAVLTARANIDSTHAPDAPSTLPDTALLFFMSGTEHLQARPDCRLLMPKLPRFLLGTPVWQLGNGPCFLDGGRGAPQAVDTLETIAAMGVKRVYCVGMCGAFVPELAPGDLVVPTAAFVEEGTSLHYHETIDEARPDPALNAQLLRIPGARALPIVTTDGVYRQTFRKEALWRAKGAVGVDMETSAMFSVSPLLGVQTAAVLMVSDCHPLREDDPRWRWQMTREMRYRLMDEVLRVVLPETGSGPV